MQLSYRIFIGLLIAAISLTFLSLFATSGSFLLMHNPKSMDVIAFYTGATILAHNANQLYNFDFQRHIQYHLLPHHVEFLAFINPPFVALFFMPFINTNIINTYNNFLTFNALLLLVLCYLAFKEIKPTKWYFSLIFILFLLTFVPIPTSLLIGQLSILLSLIFLLSWIFLKKGWEFRSGLVLSLLLMKPQFILLPLLAVLVQRRKKFIYGMLLGIVFFFTLSYLIVGWNGILMYISTLNEAYNGGTNFQIDLMSEHTLQTLLLILFQTTTLNVNHIPWLIVTACIILPTLFLWSKKYSNSSLEISFQFSLLIIATLITSPHTHFYDLSILTVVAIILLSVMNKLDRQEKKLLIFLLILYYALEFFGTFFDVQTQMYTRQIWISIDVVYLISAWAILSIKSTHLRNKDNPSKTSLILLK